MPTVTINLEALAHNAGLVNAALAKWGLEALPVLKEVGSHPAVAAALTRLGFSRFGSAEVGEPFLFGPETPVGRAGRVLIQLTPLSRCAEVAEHYQRSFQSMPETIRALAGAAAALGAEHEILLMADMGDHREGLPPRDMAEVLDLARQLPSLKVAGLGFSLACLGNKLPTRPDLEKVEALAALFRDKGVKNPVVSAGGTVLYNFVAEHSPGPITELRFGDPFLVGHDIYRDRPLAGGGYRTDVCLISAEVLEIKTINIDSGDGQPCARHAGHTDFLPRAAGLNGRRTRVLCDLGRFHTSLSAGALNLERLSCEKEGCAIVGLTAGYVAVDVTDSPEPVKVGQRLRFHPGYWAVAQACRNPLADIEFQNENESRASCAA